MAKIDPDKRYTAQEIVEIWNLQHKHSIRTVYNKIHNGDLQAINYGTKKKPVYRILGKELIRYEEEHQT